MARLRSRLPLVVAIILGFLAASIPIEAARLIRSPGMLPAGSLALGDLHVAGALHVTGTTSFRTITRIGSAGTEGNYTLHVGGTLRVNGASTLSGNVTMTDASALHTGGVLHVTGVSAFRTIVRVGGAGTEGNYTLHVGGTLRSGAATISGNVSLTDAYALHVAGNLHVEGTTSFRNLTRLGTAGTDGNYLLHVGGTLRVSGASTLSGNVTVTDGYNVTLGSGLVSAPRFTTTGTGSVSGLTLATAENVGVANSANIAFTTAGSDTVGINLTNSGTLTYTTGTHRLFGTTPTWAPGASGAGFAAAELRPTINASGAQTGTGYGLGIALVNTNLNGLRWNFIDVGTTTSTLFSGYTSLFRVNVLGSILQGTTPNDGLVRAHLAAAVHAETSLAIGAHVVTVANNASGGVANAEILSGLRSLYLVDCNDPDGCTIQLGTTGIEAGAMTKIISITTNANTLSVSDVANVQHVAGAFTMGVADAISLIFTRNRSGATSWTEYSRSDN